MKGLIVFFTISFVLLLLARIILGYFANVVPVFGALLTALTWLTVGAGVLTLMFILIKIIKEIKGKKE